MYHETLVLALILFFILGLVGLGVWRKHLTQEKQMRLRTLLHQERLNAMEKGIALPETAFDDAQQIASLGNGHGADSAARLGWVRLAALCLGLFLSFSGIGMIVAFSASMEEHLTGIWAVGFIPLMAGAGLVLFYALSRGLAERPGSGNREG